MHATKPECLAVHTRGALSCDAKKLSGRTRKPIVLKNATLPSSQVPLSLN